MEKTPFTWIDTEIQLEKLSRVLNDSKEISVDLEHHDLRSFQGFTCLIQISTRNEDYVIDALALRHHLQILNSSFTNPDIIKVFHGADSDIQWLQRDFGVYIVNLFDTYHASHVLGLQGHGLAFLLKHYCNVITDKRFQRADWRLRYSNNLIYNCRPVPADMLFYARSDTHYLLYIYDRMRNEIIDNSEKDTLNLMNIVLSRSASTSLKLYKKEIYDSEIGDGPNGWKTMLRKISINMRAEKLSVYRALHAWRDQKAREYDESIHYVLPNHMLFNLVESLPTNSQQTLACCSPIPNFVRMYSTEIISVIDTARQETVRNMKAREEELLKLKADLEQRDREFAKRKLEGPIHIRFDKDKKIENDIDLLVNAADSSHINKKFKTRVRVRFINESGLLGRCLETVKPPSLFDKAMDLNNKMKLEIYSLSVKVPVEPTPVRKEATHVEPPIEDYSIIDDVIPSSKLKTDFIVIDEEKIEIVANVGNEGKKGKKRNKSKKKSRVDSTIEENIALKEKSVIALELEKMNEDV